MTAMRESVKFDYEIALSFAGEQRPYVEELASELRNLGIRVFYDDYEQASLWGKDLYEHLDYIYRRAAEYCVQFVSAEYAKKVWTSHERKSAQARAIQGADEYILPVRFDETEIPGLRPTVGYIDARKVTPRELAGLIQSKLGPRPRKNYFPPVPDRLFAALGATSADEKDAVLEIAQSFMGSLLRMTPEERRLLASIFASGCRSEMPNNVHIDLDLLRRDLGHTPAEALSILRRMGSLGIELEMRNNDPDHGEMIAVQWWDLVLREPDSIVEEFSYDRSTEIAVAMLEVGLDRCVQCTQRRIQELDFSDLASATIELEQKA